MASSSNNPHKDTPTYPAQARGRLSQAAGQDYPTSTFRQYKEGPVGHWFSPLNSWKQFSPNLWFVPWAKVKLHNVPEDQPSPSSDGKLLVRQSESLDDNFRGSGLVIDAVESKIIGCYKTFEDHTPTAYKDLRANRSRYIFESEDMQIKVNTASNQLVAHWQAQYNDVQQKLKRCKVLLQDARPHSIALHIADNKPHYVFKFDTKMEGGALKAFGKPYRALQDEFKQAMGDLFDEEEDVPKFSDWDDAGLARVDHVEDPDATEDEDIENN